MPGGNGSSSKLQRRLIVLAVAVVLLLGPIVLMGNCSGWNEGSMRVSACTVDFPLARSLANLLWGTVPPSWRELSAGRRALLVVTTSLGAAMLLGLSLQLGAAAIQWRARSDDFALRCRSAGDRSGIEGTELQTRDRSTGSVIAKLRYFIRPVQSAFCGPAHDGRFPVGDFLVRALKLTRQAPRRRLRT